MSDPANITGTEAADETNLGQPSRPRIVIGVDIRSVADQAVAALEAEGNLFHRAGALVVVHRDHKKPKKPRRGDIERPSGSPWIDKIQKATLAEYLATHAEWAKVRNGKNGAEYVAALPPPWAAETVAARGEWPGLRPLEAVVEAPALRPDGTILDRPGWDEATSLLYEPSGVYEQVGEFPDEVDAQMAAREILDVVADFPFADEEHKAAWLAALLTPFARFAIEGPTPMFLIDANIPGTGKSKLADIIGIVATGRNMARTAYADDDAEMAKTITAVARAGDPIMLLDNIATTFGGPALDAALTAVSWRGRILGQSEMTPALPLKTIWLGSSNNVTLRGDALRRIIHIRLESPEERPEERRGFAIEGDLLQHVRRERPRLVRNALTILRAFEVAGRPRGDLVPMDYPEWSELVREAVHWSTGFDPAATRKQLQAADPESAEREALVSGWAELPGSDKGLTTAEAIEILKAPGSEKAFSTLRGALMTLSRNSDLPATKSVSKKLQAIKGRVVGGLVIRSRPDHGTQRWSAVVADPGGIGGIGPILRGREKDDEFNGRGWKQPLQSLQSLHEGAGGDFVSLDHAGSELTF